MEYGTSLLISRTVSPPSEVLRKKLPMPRAGGVSPPLKSTDVSLWPQGQVFIRIHGILGCSASAFPTSALPLPNTHMLQHRLSSVSSPATLSFLTPLCSSHLNLPHQYCPPDQAHGATRTHSAGLVSHFVGGSLTMELYFSPCSNYLGPLAPHRAHFLH